MLAYVFWHWPHPTVNRDLYRAQLIEFHETLCANKPPGFLSSTVFLINHANWLNTAGPAFEDWYLLSDSAGMDPLNQAAVSGPCEQPHNLVARQAAGGTAGLYRLRIGTADVSSSSHALWFSKPEGEAYKDFFSRMQDLCPEGSGLWGRQMTLGPTTEFCLLSPIEPTGGVTGQQVSLELVWSDIQFNKER